MSFDDTEDIIAKAQASVYEVIVDFLNGGLSDAVPFAHGLGVNLA